MIDSVAVESEELLDDVKQVKKCVWHLTRTGDLGALNGSSAVKQALPTTSSHFTRLRNLIRDHPNELCSVFVDHILYVTLQAGDSQVRLASLRLLDMFFRKMHLVRVSAVDSVQQIFLMCLETDPMRYPLPKPPSHAKQLKQEALIILRDWWTKYAPAYPKLKAAEEYVSANRSVELDALEGRTRAEREHVSNMALRRLHLVTSICEKLQAQYELIAGNLEVSLREMTNALNLMCPKSADLGPVDSTATNADGDTCKVAQNSSEPPITQDVLRLKINIKDSHKMLKDVDKQDHEPLACAIRDAYKMINVRLRPQLQAVMARTQRLGDSEPGQALLRKLIQAKQRVDGELSRVEELGLIESNSQPSDTVDTDDSDDDDDMLEVFEKLDGYDEPAQDASSDQPTVSTNLCTTIESDPSVTCQPSTSSINAPSQLLGTTRTSVSANKSSPSKSDQSQACDVKPPKIPCVHYDLDLKYWGESADQLKAPAIVKNNADCHRFWRPNESDEPCTSGSLTERVTTFAGEFEPVSRRCRAPLVDGRTCERYDRVKCPFHGAIVDRDEHGQPVDPNCTTLINKKKKRLPWLDPVAMAEIESQSGQKLNYGIGQKRRRQRRPPPLVSCRLPSAQVATRNRLKKKVLNPKAVNKAIETSARIRQKQNAEKFQSNFSYQNSK